MKIGVIDFRECAVTVNCPECNRALQKDESNTFWSDEYIPGLQAWCEHCDIMVELPDLAILKPVDAGLFQEILVTLRAFVYCNTAKAGECIHCPLKDECKSPHGLMKIGQAVIDKAKKA